MHVVQPECVGLLHSHGIDSSDGYVTSMPGVVVERLYVIAKTKRTGIVRAARVLPFRFRREAKTVHCGVWNRDIVDVSFVLLPLVRQKIVRRKTLVFAHLVAELYRLIPSQILNRTFVGPVSQTPAFAPRRDGSFMTTLN